MIVTDNIIRYIPFKRLTKDQVAELLQKSASAVDYYHRRGAKISEVEIIYLKKQRNGQYLTDDVIEFIEKLNKMKGK